MYKNIFEKSIVNEPWKYDVIEINQTPRDQYYRIPLIWNL